MEQNNGYSQNKLSHGERNSNIEILRIISIFLIIAYHASRTVYNNLEPNNIVRIGGAILGSWGILGVDCFVIISAWFLSDQQFKIKRLIAVIFQTFSWILGFYLVAALMDILKTHSIKEMVVNLCIRVISAMKQPLWSKYYWFVTAYIFMVLLSPLLNRILDKYNFSELASNDANAN